VHVPPPSSTLLPYTTLFRSREQPRGRLRGTRWARAILPSRSGRPRGGGSRRQPEPPAQPAAARHATEHGRQLKGEEPPQRDRDADRKSTRLNSSHVAIAYAG